MSLKRRLSASVDEDLILAGKAAEAAGRTPSLSAWVNDALRRQVEHDRRMQALDEYIAAYESEHGKIMPAEVIDAGRRAGERARVVRTAGSGGATRPQNT